MRSLAVLVVVVSGCISTPTVELVGSPDASSTLAADTADAGVPACDARCASAGGTCSGDTCTFTCPGAPACERDIRCPPGMPCSVTCTGQDACRGVDCRDATGCTIDCSGESACNGRVACGGDRCAVTCEDKGCKPDDVRCCATACTVNGVAGRCP